MGAGGGPKRKSLVGQILRDLTLHPVLDSKMVADLQRTITRMAALDAAMDVLRMKRELEKRGVWKRINELDEEALEDQLDAIAVRTKESGNKLETIVRILEPDAGDVKFERGAEFDRARAEIELAAREKAEGDGVGSRA